jgi:hypothetical protein
VGSAISGGGATCRGWRPRRWLPAAATVGALWVSVTGCVSDDVRDTVNERMNYGMTTSEEKLAYAAALRQVRSEQARVTARATVSGPDASASPSASPRVPPAPCTSGRLLHITLAGRFPHHPFADAARTTRVSAQVLTVDAATGRLCDAHYVSGLVVNDPTSVLLLSTVS